MLQLFIAGLLLFAPGRDKKHETIAETPPVLRVYDTIQVDGQTRYYLLNLPPNYSDTTGIPLVLLLHGAGGKATQCEQNYLFTGKANAEKFAVVYPEGTQSGGVLGLRYWNAGGCCAYAMVNHIDDVKFISRLIDKLLLQYPRLQAKKVYATGISNGAMMCYRLAAELSGKIAAIAPVSGPMMMKDIAPSRAVPILHIHSLLDTRVPYYGGVGIADHYFTPVDSTINIWASLNQCNPTPLTVVDNDKYTQLRWIDCTNKTVIECYKTKDGGHSWPGGKKSRVAADEPSTAINANDVIWHFFQQYQLP